MHIEDRITRARRVLDAIRRECAKPYGAVCPEEVHSTRRAEYFTDVDLVTRIYCAHEQATATHALVPE